MRPSAAPLAAGATYRPTLSPSSPPLAHGETYTPTSPPTAMPLYPRETYAPTSPPSAVPLHAGTTYEPTAAPSSPPLAWGHTYTPTSSPSAPPLAPFATYAPTFSPSSPPLPAGSTYQPTSPPTHPPLHFGVTYQPTASPSAVPLGLVREPSGEWVMATYSPTAPPSPAPTFVPSPTPTLEPLVTALVPWNGPINGGALITLFGCNLAGERFGAAEVELQHPNSMGVRSPFVNWVWEQRIDFVLPSSDGVGWSIALKTANEPWRRLLVDAFSYDAPAITFVSPVNLPELYRGGQSVQAFGPPFHARRKMHGVHGLLAAGMLTIHGQNFVPGGGEPCEAADNGLVLFPPCGYVGGRLCTASKWIDTSTITCLTDWSWTDVSVRVRATAFGPCLVRKTKASKG